MLITTCGTVAEKIGAIFMELSKAFDAINHSLLITKLSANGFSADSLKFILSYIKNIKQSTIIENSCAPWKKL